MSQLLLDGFAENDSLGRWLNSPIKSYKGGLSVIRGHIPSFERRAFALTQPNGERSRLNQRLDMIVRKPFLNDPNFVPVGVVSKNYTLVPHSEVLKVATKALKESNIDLNDVRAELTITEYGERMGLSLYLPDQYSFDPGDENPMTMRLECFNSVDGSTRFQALMGWFRFVCSNGLIVGVTKFNLRRRHMGDVSVSEIGTVLYQGIKDADKEKENFTSWREHSIDFNKLVPWIENDVRKAWGFKAATRTYHISASGFDVKVLGNYKDETPTTIQVKQTSQVPGMPECVQSAFDVSQVLAWLAKERNDFQEQFEWRRQIPKLMKNLLN